MSFFDFVKTAGEKLFGAQETEAAQAGAQQAPEDAAAKARVEALNRKAGDAIEAYIRAQNLEVTGLTVTFDGASSTASVFGVAKDQETREKAVLCCGNVEGVARVEDRMSVDQSAPQASFHTVVKGENLSRIAQQHYGAASKYTVIFEANRPMLRHPDKIYPGQVLRIPPP
jgi:nucleoid-associated protein YgaU